MNRNIKIENYAMYILFKHFDCLISFKNQRILWKTKVYEKKCNSKTFYQFFEVYLEKKTQNYFK